MHVMEDKGVNPTSLQHYFTYQYGPEPETLTIDVNKIEPGHYFVKKSVKRWKSIATGNLISMLQVQRKRSISKQFVMCYDDSVKVHMRSDVPVGSFLSGGIDSSIIASIAREMNPNLLTFSVGFEQRGFSEVDVAKETAEKLGVKNRNVFISAKEFMDEFPKIIWHMDDPLADPAAVPLYFVAKKHVSM
ncbi:asparagine synthase-related protein [Bacillus pacificus]